MTAKPSASAMTSNTIDCGGRQIHYSEQGNGYPVLMLHGGGPGASGVSNYSRNIEVLAQQFRVIVPDMPGYGKSSKGVKRSDPFGDLAEGMLAFLDALQIDHAHVIGNSYGGACGLRMALESPQRVASLILMGPGGINTTRGLPTKGLNVLLNYYNDNPPKRENLESFIKDYLVYDSSAVPDDVIETRYQSSIDPEVIAQPPLRRPNSPMAAWRMDFSRDKRLQDCQTPTLVIWGADDQVNRPSGGPTLQRLMPNCDLHVFSKTGHWAQWERADEFNAMASDFMARQTP